MIKVGVLRGGPSREYESSLASGSEVLEALRTDYPDAYKPIDIFIDRQGIWHLSGIPRKPEEIIPTLDVVWNSLHGAYGEDGTLARTLDTLGVPYTGSTALPSAMLMNKALAKEEFRKLGIQTPKEVVISDYVMNEFEGEFEEYLFQGAQNVFAVMSPPWVVKPKSSGGSDRVYYVNTFEDLVTAIALVARGGGDILVEEYIKGPEITVGLVQDFRGAEKYFLLPSEVKKPGAVLDYVSRVGGAHRFTSVSNEIDKALLESTLAKAYDHFGLRHYATADFIASPHGLYLLEIDTMPHLHKNAFIPQSLERVGAKLSHFVDHVIKVALQKK